MDEKKLEAQSDLFENILCSLMEPTLEDQPYNSNSEYLSDIAALGKLKIMTLYSAVVEELEAGTEQYRLRDNLIYKHEIEQLFNEDLGGINLETYREIMEAYGQLYKWIEDRCRASAEVGLIIPLDYLFRVFKLGDFEKHCIIMALMPELDRRYERVYSFLQDDLSLRLLSSDLAVKLYDIRPSAVPEYREYLNEGSELLRYFFTKQDTKNASDLSRTLKLETRIISFIMNISLGNPELTSYTQIWYPGDSADALKIDMQVFERMSAFVKDQREKKLKENILFFLHGPSGSGKKLQVRHFCRVHNQPVMFVDLRLMVEDEEEFDRKIDRICVECIIKQCVLCFCSFELLIDQEVDYNARINDLLNKVRAFSNIILFSSQKDWKPQKKLLDYILVNIELGLPTNIERKLLWESFAKEFTLDPALSLDEAANKFIFTPGQIARSLSAARDIAEWKGISAIDEDSLHKGCYSQIVHNMGKKATRVNAGFLWEDLILPGFQKELLKTACNQVKYRHIVYNKWGFDKKLPYGRGLSMLFSGPPGTGKTMAAQVVASQLSLEIYKVDLSGVVSKYIGETEKNLNEVFEEAKKSQAILFFDEADSLFGKRTEVKDSNDKYGNMEASFLLQKMEEYDGIVILATNYLQNFDDAFKRRIKFVIDFPFPDAEYRKKLWRAVYPNSTPLSEDIDYEYLARNFELSGSNIKNIAVSSAFIAASENKPVDMKNILTALRNELAKSSKVLLRKDLGEYYMLLEDN